MPRHENVSCRVDVPTVPGAALAARPLPHSESCPTLRTAGRNLPAARTGPGRTTLGDHNAPNAGVLALVLEHPAQHGPATVVNRLGQLRLADGRRPDVANHNLRTPSDGTPGPLVERIAPLVLHLRMQSANARLLAGPRRPADRRLSTAIPPAMLQPVTIRGDSHILEAEVDPNGNAVVTRSTLDSHLHAEVPVTARILDERASAEPVHLKAVGVPDAKVMPGETDGVAGPLRRPALERNPAEGTAPAATAAPTQAHLAGRLPLRGVLITDLIDGRRADQVELGTGAANERGEIEAGGETGPRGGRPRAGARCTRSRQC